MSRSQAGLRVAARCGSPWERAGVGRTFFRSVVAALVLGLSLPSGTATAVAMAAPTAAGDGIPPIQHGDVFHQSRSFWSSVLPAGQALTPARTPEISSDDSLSAEALGTAFRQAAADWRAAGEDTSGITVSVRDLPGHLLGLAHGTDVAIDDDAAGWGAPERSA